jgi:tRNA (cmo5U34)-methyltransferase
LKDIKRDAVNITDLGAGTGLLTKELYLLYPDAHFTLVDLSTDMLEVAKQRFLGLVNFDFRVEDYFDGIKKGAISSVQLYPFIIWKMMRNKSCINLYTNRYLLEAYLLTLTSFVQTPVSLTRRIMTGG